MKVKSVCVPIDPDDCGSMISGYVRYPELKQRDYGKSTWYMENSASVSLSDCSRVINWDLSSERGKYNLVKLDRAITALTKLREHAALAQEAADRLKKEMAARNKLLGVSEND